ncbi:MAG: UbiD family decarboxylase, partial [Planctomycetales bacterium]
HANAILGQGQLSLAKYLMIVAGEDAPDLDLHDVPAFLAHLLARIDWTRDLHFQTCTTVDTLDYSGDGLNEGSKVVLAAVGKPIRELPSEIPAELKLPDGFADPRVILPGVLAVRGPERRTDADGLAERFCASFDAQAPINRFPLLVLADDAEFTARTLNNFTWTTFTRSDPASDAHGIESFVDQKHWGCRGSLVVDARLKPRMPPPLVEDPEITRRVDALAARGGPLHGIL